MAKFVTSIQLYEAAEKDYETLGNEMGKVRFHLKRAYPFNTATILQRDEYNCAGDISFKDVADAVYRAIKKTGRNYSFTITDNNGKSAR